MTAGIAYHAKVGGIGCSIALVLSANIARVLAISHGLVQMPQFATGVLKRVTKPLNVKYA